MRDTLFSFLKFLQTELTGIDIHRILNSTVDSQAGLLKEDAINIQVINFTTSNHSLEITLAIDVVYNDEVSCIDKTELLAKALRKTQTQLKSFSTPSSPVIVNSKLIFWDPPAFKRISTDQHCRFNCVFKIECYERERV